MVAFLGDFSDAFNEMTKQLKEREEQLKEVAEKAERRAEMIEGYNEFLIEMLSRRKEWLLVVDRDSKEEGVPIPEPALFNDIVV